MKRLIVSVAALMAATTLAAAQTTTTTTTTTPQQNSGALTGAAGGAVTGAVVGGPVGAAVGGVAGAIIGGAIAPPPPQVERYVVTQQVPSVTVREQVVVGEPLPSGVVVYPVPEDPEYQYAFVNERYVIVEPGTRRVVKVIQ